LNNSKAFHYYTVGQITELVPCTKTVIEHRAPTDASVKLYAEMLEAARDSIVCSIEPHSNSLGIRAVAFKDHQWCDIICRYTLSLNGIKLESEITIKEFSLHGSTEERKLQVIRAVYEHAAKHIAIELCKVVDNDIKTNGALL